MSPTTTPTTRTAVPEWAESLAPIVKAYEDGDVLALKAALNEVDRGLLNSPGPANCLFKRPGTNGVAESDTEDDDGARMSALSKTVFFDAHEVLEELEPGCLPTTLLSCATWVTGNIFRGAPRGLKRHPFMELDHKVLLEMLDLLINHFKTDVNACLTPEEFRDSLPSPSMRRESTKILYMQGYHNDCMTAFDYAWRAAAHAENKLPQAPMVLLLRSGQQNWLHEPIFFDEHDQRHTCESILHMAAFNNFRGIFLMTVYSKHFPLYHVRDFLDSIPPDLENDPVVVQWIRMANERLALAAAAVPA